MENNLENLRYPVGRFVWPDAVSIDEISESIRIISGLPARLRSAVENLNDSQLDTPYREGGWTIRQVVHHIADSHMNALIRFKLALSEDVPTVKPYNETEWAEHPDAKTLPPEHSLRIVEGVHARWKTLLENMSDVDWSKKYNHPQYGTFELKKVARQYSWHSEHHLSHITRLIERWGPPAP